MEFYRHMIAALETKAGRDACGPSGPSVATDVPDHFCCPITKEIMEDPVLTQVIAVNSCAICNSAWHSTLPSFPMLLSYVDKQGCFTRTGAFLMQVGISYERSSIEEWFQGYRSFKDPITNEAVSQTTLTPNYALKAAIDDWRSQVCPCFLVAVV